MNKKTKIDNEIENNIIKISQIRDTIMKNINYYVIHDVINIDNTIDENTITVIMTTHERIRQTLFTLDTINNSFCKNIQVIIVDDSVSNYIGIEKLKEYPYRIDYVKIKPENRDWINPCVNYNIGFSYILGKKLVIQNAEVCHVNDVLNYVYLNCTVGKYLVFDVASTESYENNDMIYNLYQNNKYDFPNISELLVNKNFRWYQHTLYRPANFHFLTAIHINDFKNIGFGFDYDFALGRWCDDDELVYRIQNCLKLDIVNVSSDKDHVFGIHQYHDTVMLNTTKKYYKLSTQLNKYIFAKKVEYFKNNGIWLYLKNDY